MEDFTDDAAVLINHRVVYFIVFLIGTHVVPLTLAPTKSERYGPPVIIIF